MKVKKVYICLVALIIGVIFLYYENNFIEVTNTTLEIARLPQEFDGFKIVQLSDLHSKMFGNNQKELVSRIKKVEPDIIVFTGDLVDSKNYKEQPALKLMDEIVGIAPVYYVTGNHEFWSGNFSSLEEKLRERGVRVLRNTCESIERNGNKISVVGIDDPSGKNSGQNYEDDKIASEEIQKVLSGDLHQDFKILLSHRPELFTSYAKYDIDLIFSGHAHGGQVRLPFIGGVVSPNQGFLPQYTSGVYQQGISFMIVSRGLGNSIIPQRIFNRPEIVVVTLRKK